MIPDKIYIPQNISRSDVTSLSLPDDKGRGIEFIRKDALLEWLESKVYEHNEDRFDDGFNAALGQVIDKINEM